MRQDVRHPESSDEEAEGKIEKRHWPQMNTDNTDKHCALFYLR
jgi:hypothetical protein